MGAAAGGGGTEDEGWWWWWCVCGGATKKGASHCLKTKSGRSLSFFSPSLFIRFLDFFFPSFPHPIQFSWDLRASLTKDDSSSTDKVGAERS